MNLVVLSGRLATEPSLKYLKESGIPVLKLNIWSDENNKTHKNILIVAKRIEYLDFPKKMNNLESVYVDEHPTF